MYYPMRDLRLEPWEIFGGKRPLFVKYADIIADLIQDFKLKPIEDQLRSPAFRMAGAKEATATAAKIQFDPGVFGGKRFAHLHYKGEIFMLNRDQWRTFTARVKDDLIHRLESAGTISLEQLQDLNDAIDPIA